MRGQVDVLTNSEAQGWAIEGVGGRAELEARLGGGVLGHGRADAYRQDLEKAGHGDGRHGFTLRFNRSVSDAELSRVQIVAPSVGLALPLAPSAVRPRRIIAQGGLAEAGAPHAPHFRSRFGGLWTDLSNAPALLDGKRDLGLIDTAEYALLQTWIRDGYAILRGAIPPALCDRVRDDAERAVSGELSLYREMAGEDGIKVVPAAGSRQGKLMDLYAKSEAALQVVTHDAIARFLNLIFERPAIAFQSLYFEHGSEQPLHQDSAFVLVSSPLQLAASWTALEDVQPGSGELEYVPGSQAIPEYLFEGMLRTMPPGSPEETPFYDHLERRIAEQGLKRARFLPRKGDVLIWSADLVHGGAPIAVAHDKPTRRSLVAHYCPNDCRPGYFHAGCAIRPQNERIATTHMPRG